MIEPVQLHYKRICSSGRVSEPPLLLIHGLDSAMQTFERIAPALATSREVLLVDQRGHGLSPDVGSDYSTGVMAADILDLLDQSGISEFSVLGHSLGARTAIRLAEMSRPRCVALIIEDMEARSRSERLNDDQMRELRETAAQMRRLVPLRYRSRSELAGALRRIYGGSRSSIDSLIKRRARAEECGRYSLLFRPWVGMLYSAQANSEELGSVLAGMDMPTLLLRSDPERGSAVSDQGWSQMLEARPDSKHHQLKGIGHSAHWEDPAFVAVLVDEFLRRSLRSG